MRVTETWLVDSFSEQVKSAEHTVKTGADYLEPPYMLYP